MSISFLYRLLTIRGWWLCERPVVGFVVVLVASSCTDVGWRELSARGSVMVLRWALS